MKCLGRLVDLIVVPPVGENAHLREVVIHPWRDSRMGQIDVS